MAGTSTFSQQLQTAFASGDVRQVARLVRGDVPAFLAWLDEVEIAGGATSQPRREERV